MIAVLYVGEKGFGEGRVGNRTGRFHHSYVQEKEEGEYVVIRILAASSITNGGPISRITVAVKTIGQNAHICPSPPKKWGIKQMPVVVFVDDLSSILFSANRELRGRVFLFYKSDSCVDIVCDLF